MRFHHAILGSLLAIHSASAALDQNSDGLGDLWQLKYNASSLVAAADADGDGKTNAEESASGTDPFSSADVICVENLSVANGTATFSWPTVLGKNYQIESNSSLTGTWTNVGSPYSGTDADITANIPSAQASQFFRVRVSDKDTDSDGVTDWEEIQAGMDHLAAGERPHLGPPCKELVGDAVGERWYKACDQEKLPVWRRPCAGRKHRLADRGQPPRGDIEESELDGGKIGKARLVVGAGE